MGQTSPFGIVSMALQFNDGSLMDMLVEYVQAHKSQTFNFGIYNDVGYNQAVKGSALAQHANWLKCWLASGRCKVHVQVLRNAIKLLETRFKAEFPLNPNPGVDFAGLVAFVLKRTNLMLHHLRRLQRADKRNNCFFAHARYQGESCPGKSRQNVACKTWRGTGGNRLQLR